MKKFIKAIAINSVFVIGAALNSLPSYAVPADPRPKQFVQPDGSVITVKICGDEHHHYYLTADDYLLARRNEVFYYANVDESGAVVASEIMAVPIEKRTAAVNEYLMKVDKTKLPSQMQQRPHKVNTVSADGTDYLLEGHFSAMGQKKVLVILVEYTDKAFTVDEPYDFYNRMFMEEGFSDYGGTGSVRDYFVANSCGQFDPQLDVYGPVKLSHTISYYGSNDWGGDDQRPHEMVIEACQQLDDVIDFQDYDSDGDGFVDNVYIVYAGKGEASGGESYTVWPHSDVISSYTRTKYVFDGVRIEHYSCSNEWEGKKPDGIGTFVHEFSHVIGLPDLYATTYTTAYTPGSWSVLDSGSYNNDARTPPHYSAFERYSLGWLQPDDLLSPADITLNDISTNQAYIIRTHKENEFFMLENRQQHDWDSHLPGHGMLIWHIDYKKDIWERNTVNNNASHQYVDIVEADNNKLPSSVAGDAFPGTAGITSFTGQTSPAMKTWDGTRLHDTPITNIAENDGIITFLVGGGSSNLAFDTVEQSSVEVLGRTVKVNSVAADCVAVYDVMGRIVDQAVADAEGNATLSVTANGIYIVKSAHGASTIAIR